MFVSLLLLSKIIVIVKVKFLLCGVRSGSSNRFLSSNRCVVFVVSDQQVDYKGGLMPVKMQDSFNAIIFY